MAQECVFGKKKSILLRRPVEQNDKGISQNTCTGVLYWNLQRNDTIDQDGQRISYLYDFALLDKYSMFCYSKYLFLFS